MHVLTLGTFDLTHPGHVGLFTTCRKLAGIDGRVTVAVNTDDFIARFKSRPPALGYGERAQRVLNADLGTLVDEVLPNDGRDQPDLIASVAPDLVVVGDDWATKDYHAQLGTTQAWFDEHGITLCYVPRTGAWSSTAIRNDLGIA